MENKTATLYTAIFVIVTALSYFSNDQILLSLLFGVLACIAFAIGKSIIFMPANKLEAAKKRNIAFYEKCIKNGVHSLDTEKNRKRAELIAKDLGCKGVHDFQSYFEKGKQLYNEEQAATKQQAHDRHIELLIEEEQAEYKKLTKYANCVGNEKTIKILSEELAALRDQYRALSNFSQNASSVLLEREKDWATAGGIASGIAGGAAGVAVALDVQAQNADIRARNAQNTEMINKAQMYLEQSGSVTKLQNQIFAKEKVLNEEKLKLVENLPEETLLQHLQMKNTTVTISETGAFYVTSQVSMSDSLTIYEDVQARIDGTLIGIVSQNGKVIGEAEMVLPLYGVYPNREQSAKGICLRGAMKDVPYSVAFSARKLYAIEN